MRTIGKTLRGGASAIGLSLFGSMGLISTFGLVAVSVIAAPAAVAQAPTEAFVKNYNDAKALLGQRKYAEAISKLDAADAEAKGNQQKGAVAGGRVLGYNGTRNYSKLIDAIGAHRALGGNDKSYDGILMDAYNQTRQSAKAVEIAKKMIASGEADSRIYGFVASKALEAKNCTEALSYGQTAIDKSAKEGKKPPKDYYNILIACHLNNKNMDAYYATLEKAAPLYNDVVYWKPFIEGAKKAPKFKEAVNGVDLYRTFDAAGVKMTNTDQWTWGEQALNRGVAIEADKVLAPLIKSGAFGGTGDLKGERNKGFAARAATEAKADKAGGIAKAEGEAAAKPTGIAFVNAGESYLVNGDYAKAIDALQKGLAKGAMEPGETDYAKLKLGIAQLKSGKKDDARKTWAEVKADNGSGWLARCWIAISKA